MVAVLLWAGASFGGALPVTLIWQAPQPCPQYEEVWRRLSDRLGRAPQTPEGTTFAARAVAEPTVEGTWKLDLQTLTESGSGQRTLTAPTCEELTKRAVVVLAMAIDPLLPPPPEVAPRSLWLALGPATTLGVLPFPTAGLTGGVRFELHAFSAEVTIGTALPQRLELDADRSLSLSSPISGSGAVCLGFARERFRTGACVALGGTLLLGTAQGVEMPRVGSGGLLEVGPRLEVRVVLAPRWALRLVGGAAVSLARPVFGFADGQPAWSPGLVTGSAALVVEYRAL